MKRWNSLPRMAVGAKSLDLFKVDIDIFLITTIVTDYEKIAGECGCEGTIDQP